MKKKKKAPTKNRDSWLESASDTSGLSKDECLGIIAQDHYMAKCYKGKLTEVEVDGISQEVLSTISRIAKSLNVTTDSVVQYILEQQIKSKK